MSESQDSTSEKRYHVQVGMAEYTVSCRSEDEAIRLARENLNKELPHMNNVIRGILDKEFRVDQVG